LLEAQQQLAAADAARRRERIKTPAQLPSTDSDSTVLPNKEGGYAPNYTPTAAVDTHRDFIVDAEVLTDANENTELVPMVDRVEETFGQRPAAVLADGLNLHFRRLCREGKQGFKECPEFVVVSGARQSGEKLFLQHFTGNRAAAVGMRGTTVGVVPRTRSAVGQLGFVHVPAAQLDQRV
jgi:hypothetical protein